MVLSKTASVNGLVAEMEAALEDKDFRSIFERPVIKTASAEEETNPVEDALNQLMDVSAKLDELGLVKSAEKALIAAQLLVAEAKKKKKECKECECDPCECDEDDANGPSTMDVKPGDKPKAVGPAGMDQRQKAKTQEVKPGEKAKPLTAAANRWLYKLAQTEEYIKKYVLEFAQRAGVDGLKADLVTRTSAANVPPPQITYDVVVSVMGEAGEPDMPDLLEQLTSYLNEKLKPATATARWGTQPDDPFLRAR